MTVLLAIARLVHTSSGSCYFLLHLLPYLVAKAVVELPLASFAIPSPYFTGNVPRWLKEYFPARIREAFSNTVLVPMVRPESFKLESLPILTDDLRRFWWI